MHIPDKQLVRCPCCGETFQLAGEHLVAAAEPLALPDRQQPAEQPAAFDNAATPLPVLLVFDGGSRGNPGPGYGSYQLTVRGKANEPQRVELGPSYTSNEAEYDTLIRALEEVTRRAKHPARVQLEIRGDSQLVIKQITRAWKVKEPRLQTRAARVWELLEPLGKWSANWHPRRHSVEAFGH